MYYNTKHIFSQKEYSDANVKYRGISSEIFNCYFQQIVSVIPQEKISRILDVGCGTGQFALHFAHLLPRAQIDAVDVSESQINKLNIFLETNNITNVTTHCSEIESYMEERGYDVIVCSETIHLFEDLSLFAKKMDELLNPNGVICIRTPSPNQYAERNVYQFFPHVKYINLVRCKGPELIDAAFALYGMHICDTNIIDESKLIPAKDFLKTLKEKPFSTLYLIPKEEYSEGLRKLEEFLSDKDYFDFNFFMTSYIIRRNSL